MIDTLCQYSINIYISSNFYLPQIFAAVQTVANVYVNWMLKKNHVNGKSEWIKTGTLICKEKFVVVFFNS